MFIWDFVADKILGQIVDWFYGQVVGFLGNFFAEMGNMGVELFEMSWVQSIVLFFSYLAWALYGTGLVVACFECGIEYSSGRGNIRETALNAIKGFMAVSLFTVVPVRLYELSVTLQGQLTAGITGYGASIGDVASDIMQEFSAVESLTDLTVPRLWQYHQRIHDSVLHHPYGVCDHQGLLCQSQARRYPADPNYCGKSVHVFCSPWLYGRLHPVVQTDHWIVPDRIFAGDDPHRWAHGV